MSAVADFQNTVVKEFAGDARVEIAILSQGESRDILEEYWRNLYLRGRMLFDPTGEVSLALYDLMDTPTPFGRSFLIDRDQVVVQPSHGYDPQGVLDQLHSLLAASFGGTVSGLDVDSVGCRNYRSGETWTTGSADEAWFCGDVSTVSGDKLGELIYGAADGTDAIAGTVTGMTLQTLGCENLTTGQSVATMQAGPSWDCQASGLDAQPGDGIKVRLTGVANP